MYYNCYDILKTETVRGITGLTAHFFLAPPTEKFPRQMFLHNKQDTCCNLTNADAKSVCAKLTKPLNKLSLIPTWHYKSSVLEHSCAMQR